MSGILLKDCFDKAIQKSLDRRSKIQENEEKINDYFQAVYHFTAPDEKDHAAIPVYSRGELTRRFLSYFVGCALGRFVYSGYTPICGGMLYLTCNENDVTTQLLHFLSAVYGADTANENLIYLSDAFRDGTSPKEKIRLYFLHRFMNDHEKMYGGAPLYEIVCTPDNASVLKMKGD